MLNNLLRLVALALFFFGIARPSHANMADPMIPGDPVGEPSLLLDSIHVLHEDLVMDMRSCASHEPARVTATYRVRNDGAAKSIGLVFIAGGLHDTADVFRVTLDGQPVSGVYSDSIPVPNSWDLPSYTPGLEGENDSLEYRIQYVVRNDGYNDYEFIDELNERPIAFRTGIGQILFHVDLPEGEHTITVEYDADASGYGYGSDVYIWQLGYVLAPVRRWGSFGTLDARVLVPPDWEAASWPEMERHGDTLHGSWQGLPSDAIAISTRKNVSRTALAWAGSAPTIFALLLAFALCARLGWKKGVQLKARGQKITSAFPVALLTAVLAFMLLGGGVVAAEAWIASILDGQGVPGYGVGVGLIFLVFYFPPVLLSLLIPAGVTVLSAYVAMRRTVVPAEGNLEGAD